MFYTVYDKERNVLMSNLLPIRSVSFDTSFLLKDDPAADTVIQTLARDNIHCFLTSTVASEIEQLKIWGRITTSTHRKAMKRRLHTHATLIDFKNRLLSDAFGRTCMQSMEKHHGVQPKDIINDCTIIVSILKNGVDVFLSEDFHFTSQITREVIKEITHAACSEYHQMCDVLLYSVDSKTFIKAYRNGAIDLDIVRSEMKPIRKKEKRIG